MMINSPCRNGFSLTEISVTVMLLAIMFGTAYQFMHAEQSAMTVVRQNNLALYALESLRNRILADINTSHVYDPARSKAYLGDLRIPFPVSLEMVSSSQTPENRGILRLIMTAPSRLGHGHRRYTREIELP